MKRNGFTLIELLAVIVILAIIALIATPIILGIINDAREKANERSVELYASAVRNGIAAYQLREGKEVALGTYTSETLPFDVEYDGEVECATIELYEDGGVYVTACKVNDVEVEYTYGTKQVAKGTMGICNPLDVQIEGTYTAGDKYECDVDPNKEGYDYTFYVLTTPVSGATSVDLIMDSNINISGEAVKEGVSDKGLVAWINNEHFLEVDGNQTDWDNGERNKYGPITAMNHLATATADWTNLSPMIISTFEDFAGNSYNMGKTYTTYAKMPNYKGIDYTASWMIDYLEDSGYQANAVSGVHGYWTVMLSTAMIESAWYADCYGYGLTQSEVIVKNGVRPVINLSI